MPDCIFCKIIAGEIPSDIVYQDDKFVVFPDISPKADTHLLIVPRQHIASLAEVQESDKALLGHMLGSLKDVAAQFKLPGFRTIINTGPEGGQEVFHIHIHLLAGNLAPMGRR